MDGATDLLLVTLLDLNALHDHGSITDVDGDHLALAAAEAASGNDDFVAFSHRDRARDLPVAFFPERGVDVSGDHAVP